LSAGSNLRRHLASWAWLCAAVASRALAHDGPPYPILVDRPTGPVLLSVWADPDVGIGTYHVYLEPLDDQRALPRGCAVRVAVRPVSERLPERSFDAKPVRIGENRHHYLGEVEFDVQEEWSTRIVVSCSGLEAEAEAIVEVTPPGQGPLLDFVLYLLPFVAVGIFIVRALLTGRRRARKPS
jgi:hypothetical protein